ncbi:Swt1 family HEPN domain-containing protein [Prescottella subtropica]|uniref:Swt1 family HEPN domain-containing protein n=1 Tax=Prescottella subtropica TaxID=2545757 RepID=UPI0010F66004|nr:Swt1 family HEPN domain-containing protein [Prescottella subtropica]
MLQATIGTVTGHITGARFAPYLALCEKDPRKALELYRWNIEMSGALQEALGIAEVFLRNTIDAQLRIWNAAQPPRRNVRYGGEWVESPAGPLWAILHPQAGGGGRRHSTYQDARRRAENDRVARQPDHRRHGHPVDHDDVVAHMTFGTWNKLLPKKDLRDPSGIGPQAQRQLWTDSLHKAFPHHPDPAVIKYWVDRLHSLRNRVAHLEPLCDTDVMGYHRTVARLLRAIDPALASWYSGISRVPDVWRRKPA